MIRTERFLRRFNDYLRDRGYRHSQPREVVAREFFGAQEHVAVDQLLRRVQRKHKGVGIATVYRTLNLLQDSGLAIRRDFATGQVAYELSSAQHHDHLLCTGCGKIVEFRRDEIETMQDQVADRYGFVLQFHKMELYGVCRDCRGKRKTRKKS